MKKIILLCLAAIPFCQTADPDASWYAAVADIPDWQNAQRLTLNDKNIVALSEKLNFPQLRALDLENNQLEVLPKNFNLPLLIHLFLNNNQITALPVDFNPPELRALDLKNNLLEALPAGFNPPQLKSLYLENNKLEALPANFNPPNLEMLSLNNNQIHNSGINQMIKRFQQDKNYLPNLRYLDLSDNPITEDAVVRLREVLGKRIIMFGDIDIRADNITGDDLMNIKG